MFLVGLLSWILISALVASYASNKKGRSGALYFFLTLLLSPLIAFLIALTSEPDRDVVAKKSGLKKCPQCAEYVQGDALVCRYCGHNFKPAKSHESTEDREERVRRAVAKICSDRRE